MFYVFNMILPCFLITLVALLGFYIPNDSGEKVSMGITTLLSMTVFLMLVAENMPPTSDVLPLIGKPNRIIKNLTRFGSIQFENFKIYLIVYVRSTVAYMSATCMYSSLHKFVFFV